MNKDIEDSIKVVEDIILQQGEEVGVWYYLSNKGIKTDILVQSDGSFSNHNKKPVNIKRKRAGDLLTLLLEMASIEDKQGSLF